MSTKSTDLGILIYAFLPTDFSNFQCLYKLGLSFQEENYFEDLELDKDLYPRIIWHLWKARSYKII